MHPKVIFFEALNASAADKPIGGIIDALNHMGLICQLGKSVLSEISSGLLPAILKSGYSSLMLLNQIYKKMQKFLTPPQGE